LIASTRSPGQPDPELTPDGAREAQERKEWDEDDIPLGQLRKKPRPDLTLAPSRYDHEESPEGSGVPSSGSSGSAPEVSPFPLNVSPFVPTTATDAGEDGDEGQDGDDVPTGGIEEEEHSDEEDMEADQEQLLAAPERDQSSKNRRSLFAKNSSGGHRWCSKCDAWKPDRCHHCRYCKQCTLKSN
jgi:hypothetical protein